MNLTWDQWRWLLAIVPAWAALLLGLWNWIQNRPRRRVEVVFARLPEVKGEVIGVIFINEQGPEVVIVGVGFECADGSKIETFEQRLGPPLPTEVPPGHRSIYHYELEELRFYVQEGKAIPVRAYCRDATGHRYETPLTRETRSALLGREGSGSGGKGGER